jgi:hypothetical protein
MLHAAVNNCILAEFVEVDIPSEIGKEEAQHRIEFELFEILRERLRLLPHDGS